MEKRVKINIIIAVTFAVLVISTGVFLMGYNGNGESFSGVNEVYALEYGSSVPEGYVLLTSEKVLKYGMTIFIKTGHKVSCIADATSSNSGSSWPCISKDYLLNLPEGATKGLEVTVKNGYPSADYVSSISLGGKTIYTASSTTSTGSWNTSNLESLSSVTLCDGAYFSDIHENNNFFYYDPNSGITPPTDVSISQNEGVISVSTVYNSQTYTFTKFTGYPFYDKQEVFYDVGNVETTTSVYSYVLQKGYILKDIVVEGEGFSLGKIDRENSTFELLISSSHTYNVSLKVNTYAPTVVINFPQYLIDSITTEVYGYTYKWTSSQTSDVVPYESLTSISSVYTVNSNAGYVIKSVDVEGEGFSVTYGEDYHSFLLTVDPQHSESVIINISFEFVESGFLYPDYIPEGFVLLPSDPEQGLKHDNVPFLIALSPPWKAPDGYFSAELISAEFFNGCDTGLIFESFDRGYWAYGYYLGGIELYYDIWTGSGGADSLLLTSLYPLSDTLSIADITLKKGAYFNSYPEYDADFVTNTFFYVPEWALTEATPITSDLTITFDDGVESVSYGDTVWTESGQAQSVTFDSERGVYTFDIVYKDGSHLNTYLFDAFGDVECNFNEEDDLVFRFVENLGTEYLISLDITTLPLKKDLYVAFDSGIESVSCGDYVWDVSQESIVVTYPEAAADLTFTVKLAEGYRIVAISYVFYGATENILNSEWTGNTFTINVLKEQALALIAITTEQSTWTAPLTINFDEGIESVSLGELVWSESGQSNDINYSIVDGSGTLEFIVTVKDKFKLKDFIYESSGGFTVSRNENLITFTYSLAEGALQSMTLTTTRYNFPLSIYWNGGVIKVVSGDIYWSDEFNTHDYDFDSLLYRFEAELFTGWVIKDVSYTCNGVCEDMKIIGKNTVEFILGEGSYLTDIQLYLEKVEELADDSKNGGIDGIGSILETLFVIVIVCVLGYAFLVIIGSRSHKR